MKKLNLYLLLTLFLFSLPIVQSCDDDGYSLNDFVVRMATVRALDGRAFYLEMDNGEKLWIGAPVYVFDYYGPLDGERVIVNYTILGDRYADYDYIVKLNQMWKVLYKPVEELTADNEAIFGDDKVTIRDIWVGGKYLNVEFIYNVPKNKRHRVSLVKNTTVEPVEDGYIHLEYRYNNQDDITNYRARSFVSFNLGDYAPSLAAGTYKGIKIRVNTENDGIKILTYEFSKSENQKDIVDADDEIENKNVE